jgi:hypothetical protein
MVLTDWYSIFEKYGMKGGIGLFISVIIFIIIKTEILSKIITYLSERYIDYFMKKKGKVIISDVTTSDITNHDVFNYIDLWMYSRVPTLQFSTDYRTVVFRKYLIIYLKKHKDNLQQFIGTKSYVGMDESELWKGFLSLINNIIYDYEREMAMAGIPKVIVDKMKLKNNDTITLTVDLIEGICNSQFYTSTDNLLKVYSILNIMLSILENTIQNSEHVCNSINGQLKGLIFHDNGKIYKEP